MTYTKNFIEIERYIRNKIAMKGGFFNREQILNESIEWMQKYPFEFNSILNIIENEGSRFANDSIPSVTFGGGYANDSIPSVTFGGGYADDSIPSVTFGGGYADDSIPSVTFGSRIDDDSTVSAAFSSRIDDDSTVSAANYAEYNGKIISEHMSYVADSPMGSEHIDSSPGDYSDFERDAPLQRTMSFAPPRNE